MPSLRPASRLAGRVVGVTVVARTIKRYPAVGVGLFVWRWWRRRQRQVERTTVRLTDGETVTLQKLTLHKKRLK